MDSHVSSQETGPSETLKAHGAVVRPHSSVNFQMFLQVSGGVEALTAHEAQERPLSRVSLDMYDQGRPLAEGFVTGGAVVGSFTRVNPLVL